LKSIIGKNAAETSVINGPNQQDHVKKIYTEYWKNFNQQLSEAEVLKITILNNTIKESKPTTAEKQITPQLLIFLF